MPGFRCGSGMIDRWDHDPTRSYQTKSPNKSRQIKAVQHLLTNGMHGSTCACAKSASSTNPGYAFPSYSMKTVANAHSSGFDAACSLSSSWCEASSLLALDHAGGSELCSA